MPATVSPLTVTPLFRSSSRRVSLRPVIFHLQAILSPGSLSQPQRNAKEAGSSR
jgi:hypothetical protein